mgnify:CR=1 FL=1
MSEREALLKDAAWLRQGVVAQLIALLSDGGEETRVVGGAVRNALLGEPHEAVGPCHRPERLEDVQRLRARQAAESMPAPVRPAPAARRY